MCVDVIITMIQAKKDQLANNLRQSLVNIRERELEYYTNNCRNIGNQAALLSGLAYSGIRYHYLLERQQSWHITGTDSLEETVFLTLLSVTLGCALQTVFVSMLVAMLGPNLALRGPDESLHDAVAGMHQWNTVILALFMTTLGLLQLSVFSFMYGHTQLGWWQRTSLMSTICLSTFACVHYARIIMRKVSALTEKKPWRPALFLTGRQC